MPRPPSSRPTTRSFTNIWACSVEFLQSIPVDQLLIQTINGIVTGMILALVASGLTLIFGIMEVVNFAHGELFMLGAYIGVVVLTAGGSLARTPQRHVRHRPARRRAADRDPAPAARPRSADDHSRHVRRVAGAAELRAV